MLSTMVAGHACTELCHAQNDPNPIRAEQDEVINGRPDLDRGRIESLIGEIQSKADIDQAVRDQIVAAYQAALRRLEQAEQFQKQARDTNEAMQTVSQRIADLNQQRLRLDETALGYDLPATIPEHEEYLRLKQSELENLRKQLTTTQEEPGRRQTRLAEIPRLISQRQEELASVREQRSLPPPAGEHELLTQARNIQFQAHIIALTSEIEALETEQASIPVRAPSLIARIELLDAQAKRTAELISRVESDLQSRQRDVASRYQIEAQALQQQALQFDERLGTLANENIELARKYASNLELQRQIAARIRDARNRTDEINRQSRTAHERVAAVGLTEAISLSLKKQKIELLELRQRFLPKAEDKLAIQRVQMDLFDLQDNLALWANESQAVQNELERADIKTWDQRELIEPIMQDLVRKRSELSRELQRINNQLFRDFITLDTEERQLVRETSTFLRFVDERIIWSPSTWMISGRDFFDLGREFRSLAQAENWTTVLDSAIRNLIYPPYYMALAGFVLILLFASHSRLRGVIIEAGNQAVRGRCLEIMPTTRALWVTLLLSIKWPAVIGWVGWLLAGPQSVDSFSKGIGLGLLAVAVFIVPFEVLRNVCRADGMAQNHFAWPPQIRNFFRLRLKIFYSLAIPAVFFMFVWQTSEYQNFNFPVSRIPAIVAFLVLASYAHLFFRSEGPLFGWLHSKDENSLLYRWRRPLYLVIVGTPIALAGLAAAGYLYTAFQLSKCLQQSVFLSVGMIIVTSFMLRWLLMQRRKMAIEEARKMRLQALASASSDPVTSGGEGITPENQEQPLIDLATVSQQTREVLMFFIAVASIVALWFIWADVLPALGFLNRYKLWSVSHESGLKLVTLEDLLYAVLAGGTTYLLIRNLPGIMNLAFSQFSMLDAGARFAAVTIIRYLIMIVGSVTALNFLNVAWSQYGWLIAAATVGLGFGLQEIFANFVSGLIMLFERPCRVGDVVTVDGVTGTVTKIQMRATTITNWDRQELIVPNKEFITGRLLNWTLSNTMTRLILRVGVDYKANPVFVRELLTQTVAKHPAVLADPGPLVAFEEFGDSALLFSVRCLLASLDRMTEIKHELNSAILDALNNAGIDIPFPQHVVHLPKQT